MKNAFLAAFSMIVILGSGCSTGTGNELETLKQEKENIENLALVDVECDAWLEDESIKAYSDRKVFADLCYFSKAIERKDARYCLSGSTRVKNDCVEMMAVKLNQVQNCLEYLPDIIKTTQTTCVIKTAAVNKNIDACQAIVGSDLFARCGDVVEQCNTNPEAASVSCLPEVPQSISCDYLYEAADRSRCETEFYETFISL